jgi:hypothetical protein
MAAPNGLRSGAGSELLPTCCDLLKEVQRLKADAAATDIKVKKKKQRDLEAVKTKYPPPDAALARIKRIALFASVAFFASVVILGVMWFLAAAATAECDAALARLTAATDMQEHVPTAAGTQQSVNVTYPGSTSALEQRTAEAERVGNGAADQLHGTQQDLATMHEQQEGFVADKVQLANAALGRLRDQAAATAAALARERLDKCDASGVQNATTNVIVHPSPAYDDDVAWRKIAMRGGGMFNYQNMCKMLTAMQCHEISLSIAPDGRDSWSSWAALFNAGGGVVNGQHHGSKWCFFMAMWQAHGMGLAAKTGLVSLRGQCEQRHMRR